jgi:nucleoside-diphosphate-sugar epimerase
MTNALVGHTGFVGGNLVRQRPFQAMFNSKNIEAIQGRSFDRLVCAGATGTKWWANQNPAEDRARIDRLISNLDKVEAAQFTLISTVDVYPDPVGVDEMTPPRTDGLHAYGTNRLMLEQFVAERFSSHTIVRLPALVGAGLKKNALYDLVNDNQLELIHPKSAFQWYSLDLLSLDLGTAEKANLRVVNLATEPISMREIRDRLFPGKEIGRAAKAVVLYDFRTRYADTFGGDRGYILDRAQVMASLYSFVRSCLT